MALPVTFGTLPGPTASAASFDTNFNAVAGIGICQCTAVGTNAITLTPVTNMPTIAAYTNQQQFSFSAVASSTGGVTLQVGALASLNVYMQDGVTQASSGNIVNGQTYVVMYLAALNSGAGGFQIMSQSVVSSLVVSPIIATMTADVTLTASSTLTLASASAGTAGTWWCAGNMVGLNSTSGGVVFLQITDGTTVVCDTIIYLPTGSENGGSISGSIKNPAGNIKLLAQLSAASGGTNTAKANLTGLGHDTQLTVYRIA